MLVKLMRQSRLRAYRVEDFVNNSFGNDDDNDKDEDDDDDDDDEEEEVGSIPPRACPRQYLSEKPFLLNPRQILQFDEY